MQSLEKRALMHQKSIYNLRVEEQIRRGVSENHDLPTLQYHQGEL